MADKKHPHGTDADTVPTVLELAESERQISETGDPEGQHGQHGGPGADAPPPTAQDIVEADASAVGHPIKSEAGTSASSAKLSDAKGQGKR